MYLETGFGPRLAWFSSLAGINDTITYWFLSPDRAVRSASPIGFINGPVRIKLSVRLAMLAAAAAMLIACGQELASPRPGSGGPTAFATGAPAPDFSFTTFEGRQIALSDLKGKVVVLSFWASWCVPCRAEMPYFERTYRAQKAGGVEFIGLALQDDVESARAFLQELGITYPNGIDERNQVALRYQVTGLPTTVFIDPGGVITRKWAGPISERELATAIDEARRG